MYLSLEKLEANLEFWRSLLIVSSASLEALRNERAIGTSNFAAQSRATATVKEEITRLLSGKTFDQLAALQSQVQRKLASGEPVDVEYWEGLLKELIVWKAKGKLRDMHEVVLNNRLEQLRRKQRDEAVRFKEEVKSTLHVPAAAHAGEGYAEAFEGTEANDEDGAGETVVAEEWDEALAPPTLRRIPEELRGCELLDAEEEKQKLVRVFDHFLDVPAMLIYLAAQYTQRRSIVQTRFVAKTRSSDAEAVTEAPKTTKDEEIYQAAVGQGLDEEEELFNMEVEMSKTAYTWEDKYRPRKPRYFNKVHTGYEWNKYNQTHYECVFSSFSGVSVLPRCGKRASNLPHAILTRLALLQHRQPSPQGCTGVQVCVRLFSLDLPPRLLRTALTFRPSQAVLPGSHRQGESS